MTYFFWYPSIDVFFSLISCNTFTFRLKKKKKKTLAKLLGAFLNNMDLLGRIQPVLLTSKNMSACVILSIKYQDACEFT